MRMFLIDSVVLTASHSRMIDPFLALRFFTALGLPVLFEEEEDWLEEEDGIEEEELDGWEEEEEDD